MGGGRSQRSKAAQSARQSGPKGLGRAIVVCENMSGMSEVKIEVRIPDVRPKIGTNTFVFPSLSF